MAPYRRSARIVLLGYTGIRQAHSHAVDVTDTLDTAVASLDAHRAYLDGLGPDNWMADARTLITTMTEQAGQRFGDRPAVAFELLHY